MRQPFTFRRALLLLPVVFGCRAEAPPVEAGPPAAEFVLAAGDSTYWVSSADGAIHVRGAPMELARVDGRLFEIYVADDDRSFEDAVLIGQRVYRRDLVSGDSLLVYQDTLVPSLARQYARLHPDDRPLRGDEQESAEPLWRATATLDITDVHGPFLSFALHTDVERETAPLWHTSRRGVIDLRSGGPATLLAVAGGAAPEVERQRAVMLAAARDSVLEHPDDPRARAALPFYRLDPGSFTLTTVDGSLAVAYAAPGAGPGDAGHLLPLAPIRIPDPAWWRDASASLPIASADGGRALWRRRGYDVLVLYDPDGTTGRLALRDSTSREFPVARVPAPASRIVWLDQPAMDTTARRALARAFDESAAYDEAVRSVSFHRPVTSPSLRVSPRRATVRSFARNTRKRGHPA